MRLALYGPTILASAFLLFAVQPMAGKAMLPRLGGVPGAWTACLLFFQAALLVGYGYVWLGARLLSPRGRVLLHLALAGLTLGLAVPFAFPGGPAGLSPVDHPAAWALGYLALNVGLAFTLLSATAPLLQHWFARTEGRRPYFLYAASNAGSLGALLAYPFLVEPYLDLTTQQAVFRWGFGAVALGLVLVGIRVWTSAPPSATVGVRRAPASGEAVTWRRRATWVGLAFVPTMLLAGASAYLSLDLAPVPLLWVVPLALYLLSFILAFSERAPAPPPVLGRAACLVAVVLVFVTVTHANEPVWLIAALHLLFLGAGSWIAHRRLADDAPDPRYLPEYFAWIAAGGALGTLVSGVVAPAVLPDLWEYPAAIALACAARARRGVVVDDRPWKTDLPHVAAAGGLVAITGWLVPELGLDDPQLVALAAFGPGAIYAYRWMPLRRRFTLCLLAIVLAGGLTQERGTRRLTTRSFFGVLRVVDQGDERHLLHGTTLHGTQRLDERDGCVPHAYYTRAGPLGWAFAAHRGRGGAGRTLAIGLGTGAIACYAIAGEPWRFVEINPDVARVARDPRWFTYLRQSPSEAIEVTLGDGRVGLREEAEGSLALIVVDAFNSDSVPVHLLTREAVRGYVDALEPGGWALLHLSNRVLDLRTVLADVVAAEGLSARLADAADATWAAVARRPEDLRALDERWIPLEGGDPAAAWTDSFSSLLPVIGAER
ncbi:MAG TPA: fused MFS/spermidine synthase [Sandaracinaceae bacterium LLY-WYZ-13_1]|nr:fused MFS/spermidine synthase [Sandaracinaceae bacterium LLY-WYZ-13_1]